MSAGTSFKTETVSQGKNFMPESQHQSPFLYLKNKQQNLGGRLTFGSSSVQRSFFCDDVIAISIRYCELSGPISHAVRMRTRSQTKEHSHWSRSEMSAHMAV